MKDQIRSAQIVVPCANLKETLKFFIERLAFRVEMIFPADAPQTAVISGYGVTLRLEVSSENQALTLRLEGDFSTAIERETLSLDGVRIILIDEKSPVEIPEAVQEFVVSTLEGNWSEGRAGMLYRDLIPGRLGGRFIASHILLREGGEVADYVHYHKIRFQMIYCLSGWARLVYENQGEPFVMRAGDCVLQPPLLRHRVLESSAGFEVLEIGCPAAHETFADYALNLPNETRAPEKLFGGQRFAHHIAEKAVWNDSKIKGFQSRDTGISEATDGLADARVLRTISDARFSVKHSGEFLFFFILKGNLRLSDGEGKSYLLAKGGSFVLPADTKYSMEAERETEILRVSFGG